MYPISIISSVIPLTKKGKNVVYSEFSYEGTKYYLLLPYDYDSNGSEFLGSNGYDGREDNPFSKWYISKEGKVGILFDIYPLLTDTNAPSNWGVMPNDKYYEYVGGIYRLINFSEDTIDIVYEEDSSYIRYEVHEDAISGTEYFNMRSDETQAPTYLFTVNDSDNKIDIYEVKILDHEYYVFYVNNDLDGLLSDDGGTQYGGFLLTVPKGYKLVGEIGGVHESEGLLILDEGDNNFRDDNADFVEYIPELGAVQSNYEFLKIFIEKFGNFIWCCGVGNSGVDIRAIFTVGAEYDTDAGISYLDATGLDKRLDYYDGHFNDSILNPLYDFISWVGNPYVMSNADGYDKGGWMVGKNNIPTIMYPVSPVSGSETVSTFTIARVRYIHDSAYPNTQYEAYKYFTKSTATYFYSSIVDYLSAWLTDSYLQSNFQEFLGTYTKSLNDSDVSLKEDTVKVPYNNVTFEILFNEYGLLTYNELLKCPEYLLNGGDPTYASKYYCKGENLAGKGSKLLDSSASTNLTKYSGVTLTGNDIPYNDDTSYPYTGNYSTIRYARYITESYINKNVPEAYRSIFNTWGRTQGGYYYIDSNTKIYPYQYNDESIFADSSSSPLPRRLIIDGDTTLDPKVSKWGTIQLYPRSGNNEFYYVKYDESDKKLKYSLNYNSWKSFGKGKVLFLDLQAGGGGGSGGVYSIVYGYTTSAYYIISGSGGGGGAYANLALDLSQVNYIRIKVGSGGASGKLVCEGYYGVPKSTIGADGGSSELVIYPKNSDGTPYTLTLGGGVGGAVRRLDGEREHEILAGNGGSVTGDLSSVSGVLYYETINGKKGTNGLKLSYNIPGEPLPNPNIKEWVSKEYNDSFFNTSYYISNYALCKGNLRDKDGTVSPTYDEGKVRLVGAPTTNTTNDVLKYYGESTQSKVEEQSGSTIYSGITDTGVRGSPGGCSALGTPGVDSVGFGAGGSGGFVFSVPDVQLMRNLNAYNSKNLNFYIGNGLDGQDGACILHAAPL